MSNGSSDLLRLLGSGAGSVGAASKIRGVTSQGGQQGATGVEQAAFADLLERAKAGELSSGRPIEIDDDAGVTLSDAEMAMLTVAADKAEAAGIRRAVVMTGGQAVILDVGSRTVVGKAESEDGVISGIDGVIRLGADGATEVDTMLRPPSGFIGENPSLLAAMQARQSDQGTKR